MKLKKGFFKICHNFPYSDDSDLTVRQAVIDSTLQTIRQQGYEGVVTNLSHAEGYLNNQDNWRLLERILQSCRRLGLRVWIYDEKGYPSGAAGVQTLTDDPSLEAKALAAVHKVLRPGERIRIPLPHGHLCPMGAFSYPFAGEALSASELSSPHSRPAYGPLGYEFVNDTPHSLLCLAFFTKFAFEGTHCQHNAAYLRRYIDLAHPRAGATFVENTYKPYLSRLAPYLADGTVESFFMDEPSYMAVYFNLKKIPRNVVHLPDPLLPLYAMVTWSDGLEDRFEKAYGYSLKDRLPFLFFGDLPEAQSLRIDYYSLLTELARKHFFAPIADCCEAAGVFSSGHILLEERITDHPRFQGNFFPLLKTMHVPGMDMLDSLPERVWKKSFTTHLVSSISRLHREGDVMDEVSCHFQKKFSVPLSPRQVYTSLAIQHFFGATLFTSYFEELIHSPLPTGKTTVEAFCDLLRLTDEPLRPALYLHYPIEAVMGHTVNPVDVATVFDSILNEFTLPYPLDRKDLDAPRPLRPLVEDSSASRGKALEQTMERAMFALMDRQIPFTFTDTATLRSLSPSVLVIEADAVEESLGNTIPLLLERGWRIYALEGTATLPKGVIPISLQELPSLAPSLTDGDTQGIAAMHTENALFLANSDDREKTLTLSFAAKAITETCEESSLPFTVENDSTRFTLPPYGVVTVRR